jgi:nucleotide-binding universal stress UspA family protein
MNPNYLIVVGVDGSDGGRRALDWAAAEAAARGGAVQAVVAWRWDGIESGPGVATNPQDERRHAEAILKRELDALAARHGTAHPVTGAVVEGRAAPALTTAARTADLLVLGSHGHSRLRHTVLGSVSEECVRLATIPVVVIPLPVPAAATKEPALRG